MTATGCGDGWPLAREMVWGDANRFPEPVVLVDFTGAGMPNTWDPNVPPPTPPIFYYYLHDALGSVVALTDNVGRLVERYTYDPYGRVVVEGPVDPDGPSQGDPCTSGCEPVEWMANICGDDGGGGGDEVLTANSLTYSAYGNPFMWTGQRYDAVTGTYQFHYRTYSPTLGRWLQRDPAGYVDGVNLYQYVRCRPTIKKDRWGLDSCPNNDWSDPNRPNWDPENNECHMECASQRNDRIKGEGGMEPAQASSCINSCRAHCDKKAKEGFNPSKEHAQEFWKYDSKCKTNTKSTPAPPKPPPRKLPDRHVEVGFDPRHGEEWPTIPGTIYLDCTDSFYEGCRTLCWKVNAALKGAYDKAHIDAPDQWTVYDEMELYQCLHSESRSNDGD